MRMNSSPSRFLWKQRQQPHLSAQVYITHAALVSPPSVYPSLAPLSVTISPLSVGLASYPKQAVCQNHHPFSRYQPPTYMSLSGFMLGHVAPHHPRPDPPFHSFSPPITDPKRKGQMGLGAPPHKSALTLGVIYLASKGGTNYLSYQKSSGSFR